jgi:hypothetical protein
MRFLQGALVILDRAQKGVRQFAMPFSGSFVSDLMISRFRGYGGRFEPFVPPDLRFSIAVCSRSPVSLSARVYRAATR